MSISYANLTQRLKELTSSRKEFLSLKTQKIKLINIPEELSKNNDNTNPNIKYLFSEELSEIDQQIESLSSIIETSINIAKSIISPIIEKETILLNVNNTKAVLEIEKELKILLNTLENESVIEKKIEIILNANKLINKNQNIFKSYHEKFMQKSLDVLSFLRTGYNSFKEKIIAIYNTNIFDNLEKKEEIKEKNKEINLLIKEMEKNVILIYNLSNKKEFLFSFFEFLGENIQKSECSDNLLKNLNIKIMKLKTANNLNNDEESEKIKEEVIKISNIIKFKIQKIFLKVSHCIQERQKDYILLEPNISENNSNNNIDKNEENINKENDTIKNNDEQIIFHKLLCIIISKIEPYQINLIKLLIDIIKIMEENAIIYTNDLICIDSSFVISICEKFKFYITILNTKLEKYYSIPNNINNTIQIFLKNFNIVLYDLGEKYCNNELLFMKNNIVKLFEDDSNNYQNTLINCLDYNYDELSGNILNYIEDIFYIMKTSGERAVSTLNLQIALGIINHIKVILNEDLYFLLDYKIFRILNKQDNSISGLNEEYFRSITKNIQYYCNDQPCLTDKNVYGNLFLISCLDSIDQTKENIPLLLEELKNIVNQNIINSKIFDTNLIKLLPDIIENDQIIYFKSSELQMINLAFSDIDSISNRYGEFIQSKIKISFEYFYYKINSYIDILNNTNYVILQSNIANAEMNESFSSKFIAESEKYLAQWKNQLSENLFEKFMDFYSEYVAGYIEIILKRKNFNNYGIILLQKDITKICNYLQGDLMIGIREKFNRLFSFIKILSFDSKKELEQHMEKYDDIILSQNEIEFIISLKTQ